MQQLYITIDSCNIKVVHWRIMFFYYVNIGDFDINHNKL
jgi:hypothetical protein